MQAALIARILADSAVTAIVARKGYWGVVPQNTTKPYFRMQVISDVRPQHLKGYDGSRPTRVQVDCYGATYAASVALAQAIISATAEPATTPLGRFGRTHAEGPRDLGEDTTAGFVHRASVDLLVRHRLA